jgi:hypothetical protein
MMEGEKRGKGWAVLVGEASASHAQPVPPPPTRYGSDLHLTTSPRLWRATLMSFMTIAALTLAALLLPLVILLWATESRAQRIRRWHRSGLSQRAIAQRLGVSRYAVSRALAGA